MSFDYLRLNDEDVFSIKHDGFLRKIFKNLAVFLSQKII